VAEQLYPLRFGEQVGAAAGLADGAVMRVQGEAPESRLPALDSAPQPALQTSAPHTLAPRTLALEVCAAWFAALMRPASPRALCSLLPPPAIRPTLPCIPGG
jgi:hypothetical protein